MPRYKRFLSVIMILLLLVGTVLAEEEEFNSFNTVTEDGETPEEAVDPVDTYDKEHPEILDGEHLVAKAAILIDYETGDILFEKDADERMNPASTTKIMTCMLALERYGDDLDEYITIPVDVLGVPEGSSVVPVVTGEQMSVRDLLFGMMMHSGNDAAIAVAVLVGGSVENFVDMMNERAALLGCTSTHFANPHGYTQEDHYTTARDMAVIARAAMANDTFRGIVKTMKYTMQASNMRGAKVLTNTNLWGASVGNYRYKYGNGIKTGYTDAAGQCLVGSATNDEGVTLISVVFHSTVNDPNTKWADSTRLMNYGFTRYTRYSFDELYAMTPVTVQIADADPDDENGGVIPLNAVRITAEDFSDVLLDTRLGIFLTDLAADCQVEYSEELVAPIEENTVLGTLTYTAKDGTCVTAKLVAGRSVARAPSRSSEAVERFRSTSSPWLITSIIVLLVLLLIVWWISAASKKRARRKRQIEKARLRALKQKREAEKENGADSENTEP